MLIQFSKAKSYYNNFWVGVVRNEHDFLSHGTSKSAIKNELMD